jgi:MFS superfamily sulfate permease-like transporter
MARSRSSRSEVPLPPTMPSTMSLVAAFLRTAAPQSRGSRAEHHVPSRSGLTIFTTDLLYWIISLRLALRDELLGGLVSVSLAIPLAMGYGMFAFTALGDSYFAHGALAGLYA